MQADSVSSSNGGLPLAGCRVIERSRSVAAAYAGRLLAAMGAEVVMLEPSQGSELRTAPPLLDDTGESALFAYLQTVEVIDEAPKHKTDLPFPFNIRALMLGWNFLNVPSTE